LKQKNFIKALSDVNECLKFEPNNVKALLRKAQAFLGENQLREALDVYERVLEIENENQIAKFEVENLRRKVPPKNAFRMKIEEINDSDDVKEEKIPKKLVKNCGKLEVSGSPHVPKLVQNIVVEDPNPFDKFKPKEDKKPRESLIMPGEAENTKEKKKILIQEIS
jgi:tetratricopeptide (TPR) repeat protein